MNVYFIELLAQDRLRQMQDAATRTRLARAARPQRSRRMPTASRTRRSATS
jgi:hypothetical protein